MKTKTIWKYPLALVDTQTLVVPDYCYPRSVILQNNRPVLYCEVMDDGGQNEMRIDIFGTGHPIDMQPRRFLGTIQLSSGYVFHVFLYLFSGYSHGKDADDAKG